jgi:hypothetical protein
MEVAGRERASYRIASPWKLLNRLRIPRINSPRRSHGGKRNGRLARPARSNICRSRRAPPLGTDRDPGRLRSLRIGRAPCRRRLRPPYADGGCRTRDRSGLLKICLAPQRPRHRRRRAGPGLARRSLHRRALHHRRRRHDGLPLPRRAGVAVELAHQPLFQRRNRLQQLHPLHHLDRQHANGTKTVTNRSNSPAWTTPTHPN